MHGLLRKGEPFGQLVLRGGAAVGEEPVEEPHLAAPKAERPRDAPVERVRTAVRQPHLQKHVPDGGADAADLVVLGTSTWGVGDLQDDWAAQLSKLQAADLSGRKVALFGEGDQAGFGDSFVSGMGALAEEAEKKGATLVGQWSAEGYTHTASAAQRGDKFVGLALDEMNEADKTADRIAAWTAQVKAEAGV